MVVGRYLPTSNQDTHSPPPQTIPPVDSVPSPPLSRTPTHPARLGSTSDPGTPIPWSRSNTPPSHPPATPHRGQLGEINDMPTPGPSEQGSCGRHEDYGDRSDDDPPARKRQKKTRTRQKENPIMLLTTAIERNTQIIEEQHRQSYQLLERTAEAQQKMLQNLVTALGNN